MTKALFNFSLQKGVGLVSAALVILIIFGLLSIQHSKQPPLEADLLSRQLSDVQTQLAIMHQQLAKPAEKMDLNAFNHDFQQLKALLKEFKPNNENELNHLMQENNEALSNKLEAMQILLNSLDQKQHPIKLLAASALPFQVVSIDSIQQINIVSVLYHFNVTPLEKNDSLAGWTVLRVNFGKQLVEFENASKEHVVVRLDKEEGA